MESDEELLKQIRQGSEKAFEILYERYEPRLYGFIFRRMGNRQDAEEIFQESMMAILKNIGIDFSTGGFTPWIYKISLNLCLNRQRRKSHVISEELVNLCVDPGEMHDVVLVNREKQFQIAKAQRKLPTILSELYKMWADGQSYEDMARLSNLPLGTVKSRIHAAITRLREEIKS